MLTKRNYFKGFGLMLCVSVGGYITSSARAIDKQAEFSQQAENAVRQFWINLSRVDRKAYRKSLDEPVIFQEITTGSTGPSYTVKFPQDFDKTVKDEAPLTANLKEQYKWFGVTLTDVKVQPVTSELASVTYNIHVRAHKLVDNSTMPAQMLPMVTVVRYYTFGKKWKISYTTIPE